MLAAIAGSALPVGPCNGNVKLLVFDFRDFASKHMVRYADWTLHQIMLDGCISWAMTDLFIYLSPEVGFLARMQV